MSGSVRPLKQTHGAYIYTDAVCFTNVPVNCYIGSVYAKFLRRLYGSPDIMTLMLTHNFSIFLEIWIYWQNNITYSQISDEKILAFLLSLCSSVKLSKWSCKTSSFMFTTFTFPKILIFHWLFMRVIIFYLFHLRNNSFKMFI